MNRIILSKERNPYYNIALEYELMKKQATGTTMFLWLNASSVIIGRNQNLYKECDVNYLKEQKIYPVRRFSGGGAVYHDEGNINVSFVCPSTEADEEKMKHVIENAVKTLGISCSFTGRNDLIVDGKKISGHAYYEEDGRFLYHGTLLCNVNMDCLERVLCPSEMKLQSKGISSVKSRVANLFDLVPTLNKERVIEALVNSFSKEYELGCLELKYEEDYKDLQKGSLEQVEVADEKTHSVDKTLVYQLMSREWIYGEAPSWNIELEKKYSYGLVSAGIKIKDGKIAEIKFYTDSLFPLDFSGCERDLVGRWFDETEIFDEVEKSVLSLIN